MDQTRDSINQFLLQIQMAILGQEAKYKIIEIISKELQSRNRNEVLKAYYDFGYQLFTSGDRYFGHIADTSRNSIFRENSRIHSPSKQPKPSPKKQGHIFRFDPESPINKIFDSQKGRQKPLLHKQQIGKHIVYSKEKLEKPSKPDYWLKGGQKYEGESGSFLYGKAKVGQFHSLPHAARK